MDFSLPDFIPESEHEREQAETDELARELIGHFIRGQYKSIIALLDGETTRVYTQADPRSVYECMIDVAKRLSMLPAYMPAVVEGCPLVNSGSDLDGLLNYVVGEIPSKYQSIVIGLGDEGDAVFVMGEPIRLTYLAVRTARTMEEASGEEFR